MEVYTIECNAGIRVQILNYILLIYFTAYSNLGNMYTWTYSN